LRRWIALKNNPPPFIPQAERRIEDVVGFEFSRIRTA
jgi:hypothetical protein